MSYVGQGLSKGRQQAGDLVELWCLVVQTAPFRFTKCFDKVPCCLCLMTADLGLGFIFPQKKKARLLDVEIAQVADAPSPHQNRGRS